MLGVEGQLVVKLKIGDLEDFINPDDFESLTLIEEAGNVLPTYELIFSTQDESLLRYLNEGNPITISFGETIDTLINSRLMVFHPMIAYEATPKVKVRLTGMFDFPNYLSNSRIKIYQQMSGVECIYQVVSEFFSPVFNIEKSQDAQTWIQHNIPSKAFVNHVWMHSYLPSSFVAVGISIDGKFILKDIIKELSIYPRGRWVMSTFDEKMDSIAIDGLVSIDSESGFFNFWYGYERKQYHYSLDDGIDFLMTTKTKPVTVSSLNRTKGLYDRLSPFRPRNDNVHENYWEAYSQNLGYLVNFSSTRVEVTFPRYLKDMRVLDVVLVKLPEAGETVASHLSSGLYVITKLSRSITNKRIATTCVLCKESLDSLKGEVS